MARRGTCILILVAHSMYKCTLACLNNVRTARTNIGIISILFCIYQALFCIWAVVCWSAWCGAGGCANSFMWFRRYVVYTLFNQLKSLTKWLCTFTLVLFSDVSPIFWHARHPSGVQRIENLPKSMFWVPRVVFADLSGLVGLFVVCFSFSVYVVKERQKTERIITHIQRENSDMRPFLKNNGSYSFFIFSASWARQLNMCRWVYTCANNHLLGPENPMLSSKHWTRGHFGTKHGHHCLSTTCTMQGAPVHICATMCQQTDQGADASAAFDEVLPATLNWHRRKSYTNLQHPQIWFSRRVTMCDAIV